MDLNAASRLTVPRRVIEQTGAALREYGGQGCEGLVLWLGRVEQRTGGAEACVTHCLVPPQHPIQSEDGVGYFVSADTLFALNRLLAQHKLRLLAQVHSHPTEAFHSSTDDRYAIVTTEGGFSIVVPDFGERTEDPSLWAVYRLGRNGWDQLPRHIRIHVLEDV